MTQRASRRAVMGVVWGAVVSVLLLAGCASGAGGSASAADTQRRVDARLALANAYYVDGKYEVALHEVDNVLQLAPRHADALGLRGVAQWQLGEPERALESLQRALRADPDSPALQNNLGWMMCESGKPEQGLIYLDRALAQRRYASPANAAMNAGQCCLRQGDRTRAESYFRRALAFEPALVPAQAQLARLAVERGDYVAARAPMLAVLGSGKASADDYAIAVRIERQLGDRYAEQSLISQWQRRFPDSPQLRVYQRGSTDEQ